MGVLVSNFEKSISYTQFNEQIDAQGIQFGMKPETVFELLKDKPEEEMCVYGYEYMFEESGLNIGFRLNSDEVRRITVKNTYNSILSSFVGDTVESAKQNALASGYVDDPTVKGRMNNESVYFTAVSKDGVVIDQLILEIIDSEVLN